MLDARSNGFSEGNIPGSVQYTNANILNGDKTMKSKEDRLAAMKAAGVDPTKDIVVSCSGGLASSSLYFGLKDITEGKLAMYDGSYSEYSSA